MTDGASAIALQLHELWRSCRDLLGVRHSREVRNEIQRLEDATAAVRDYYLNRPNTHPSEDDLHHLSNLVRDYRATAIHRRALDDHGDLNTLADMAEKILDGPFPLKD